MPGLSNWMAVVPRRPLAVVAAVLCVAITGVLVWQVGPVLRGSTRSADSSGSPVVGLASTEPSASALRSEPSAMATASLSPTSTAAAIPGPTPTNPPTIPQAGASWQPDSVLVQAKVDGRVTIDSTGRTQILATAPPPPDHPPAAALDTRWTGLIQEPPRVGIDDKGVAYTDYNYSLFCGAGAAAVVLYYWPATRSAVTTRSAYFAEPVNLGANRYTKTYWKAQDAGGYGRGMILDLAENEWPLPDRNQSWWPRPGLMNWDAHPPSTYVQNLVDGINWEASGQTRLNYFYVIVPASQLTVAALSEYVHADIDLGVPVVIAARTSDGTNSLPSWRVKSTAAAVNHFVTVVGYDDTAATYMVMDTCGTTCNDRNIRSGVRPMSQAGLFSLIQAESDDDGIMW